MVKKSRKGKAYDTFNCKYNFLLLSRIPATGKSEFGKFLSREHQFVHYNMERDPEDWPIPNLHPIWNRSRAEFVAKLRQLHNRVVLDWGFPPQYLNWVVELKHEGVHLVWFTGSIPRARELFTRRGGRSVIDFDVQVNAITESGLPDSLGAQVVNVFNQDEWFRDFHELFEDIMVLRK